MEVPIVVVDVKSIKRNDLLLSIHVLRHKPAYCREAWSNLHGTDTVSKGWVPRIRGKWRGKKERNQKRSTLFPKATAEQHIREPGRQRQAKEDTSHVCPPTQEAEMEPSINYHQKWPTLTLVAPVQALGHRKLWNKFCHINMGTGEAFHSLKQNCVIKAH